MSCWIEVYHACYTDSMQNIHENLKNSLKEAMKAKDTVRLDVIRGLLTAFTNELVATGKTPQDMLPDDAAIKVIRRTIKQREDAIGQYEAAGRTDLADEDKAQLEILKTYVPAGASEDEIRVVAERVKSEAGEIDKSKMGILVGKVMKEFGDRADGSMVKKVIESMF